MKVLNLGLKTSLKFQAKTELNCSGINSGRNYIIFYKLKKVEEKHFNIFLLSVKSEFTVINKSILKQAKIGEIFSWNEVSEIHKTRHGIYQLNERLISLLTDFGRINPCYPDFHGKTGETIFYTGAGRRGDQKLDIYNRALFNAVESGEKVPLFNKLAVGCWEFTGFWKVLEGKYIFDELNNRMIWLFTLKSC